MPFYRNKCFVCLLRLDHSRPRNALRIFKLKWMHTSKKYDQLIKKSHLNSNNSSSSNYMNDSTDSLPKSLLIAQVNLTFFSELLATKA